MGLFKKKKKELYELELSEKHVGLRVVLVIVLFGIGLAGIGFGLFSLLGEEDGWQTIELTEKSVISEDDFALNYNLGAGELSATKEKRLVENAYTELLNETYKLFDIYNSYDGIVNLYHLNRHHNEELKVSGVLYDAIEKVKAAGSRDIYLGSLQSVYRNVFLCTDDINAADSDPARNQEDAEFLKTLSMYASDPEMIDLELLGDDKVKLFVSSEYASFAAENGIEDFIDFSWLANAFIIDRVADGLAAMGYTNGFITSYDGYVRYLNPDVNSYAAEITDRVGNAVYPAATIEYTGTRSLVQLRSYPMNSRAASDFYTYSDGEFASRYIDAKDGRYKSSINDIMAYSDTEKCADIALALSPIFVADELDIDLVDGAKARGINFVWCENRALIYNDANLKIQYLYDLDGITYTSKCAE